MVDFQMSIETYFSYTGLIALLNIILWVYAHHYLELFPGSNTCVPPPPASVKHGIF